MIWVLLIHCLYWTGLIPDQNIYKSYILLEMPVFFFIAGASNSLSKKKNIIDFIIARLERILIPYWMYAVICIILTHSSIIYFTQPDKLSYIDWIFPLHNPWSTYPYVTWHLWFIPIYILVMLVFPLITIVVSKIPLKFSYLLAILFIIVIYYLDSFNINSIIKSFVFYLFWASVGSYYTKFKNNPLSRWKLSLIMLVSWFLCFLLVTLKGYSANMQINKFPPNTAFLMLNIGTFCLIVICIRFIKKFLMIKFIKKILLLYSTKGYTIYLFHPFAFLIIRIINTKFHLDRFVYFNPIFGLLYYFLFIILLGIIISRIFGSVENIKILRYNRFLNKKV